MPNCSLCRTRIQGLDFYFETPTGRICSTCLVVHKAPREEVAALFRETRPETRPHKDREMGLDELRRVVWG